MPERSAGILMYRQRAGVLEVLLVHPGGPFWAKKDEGAWTIPKGVYGPDEDALVAAKREFEEETGVQPAGKFSALGEFRQSSAKTISIWAVEGDLDPAEIKSNSFSIEWPPKSGKIAQFPEVDRAGWFSPQEARRKILKGQRAVLDALVARLRGHERGRIL